jgi:hypothetical protein
VLAPALSVYVTNTGDLTKRKEANDVFSAVDEAGTIG